MVFLLQGELFGYFNFLEGIVEGDIVFFPFLLINSTSEFHFFPFYNFRFNWIIHFFVRSVSHRRDNSAFSLISSCSFFC